MKRPFLYALFATLWVSCKSSVDCVEPQTGTQVQFVLKVSDGKNNEVDSKSSNTYNDVYIRYVDILVFDRDRKFIERVQVDSINGTGAGRAFFAKFIPTAARVYIDKTNILSVGRFSKVKQFLNI